MNEKNEKHELWHLMEKDDFNGRLIGQLVAGVSTHPNFSHLTPERCYDHFAQEALRNSPLVKTAHSVMSKALKDSDLRYGYVSNIAMMLYDNARADKPLDLSNAVACNEMAEHLLKLMFD